MIERNQRLAYQRVLDKCEDIGITEAELQEAQAQLKPNIKRPEMIDYERMRKYFGNVPADIVQRTFNTHHSYWYATTFNTPQMTIQVTKPCSQPPSLQ